MHFNVTDLCSRMFSRYTNSMYYKYTKYTKYTKYNKYNSMYYKYNTFMDE